METNIDAFLPFDWITAHPPQGTWTNEEIRFNCAECMRKCTRYETAPFSLTWDKSIATNPSTRVIGFVSAAAEEDPLKAVPMEFRQYLGIMGKEAADAILRTPTLRLQDRPPGRKHSALGTLLPLVRRRTPDPERMADRDGKDGENQVLHIRGQLTNPLHAKTTRTRITPMCGLPSPESDHHPKSVPTTSDAGAARLGPRGTMVSENGPQKWISPDPNP